MKGEANRYFVHIEFSENLDSKKCKSKMDTKSLSKFRRIDVQNLNRTGILSPGDEKETRKRKVDSQAAANSLANDFELQFLSFCSLHPNLILVQFYF